jgi:xanthine dehydrogenase molybdenum-binding subunit
VGEIGLVPTAGAVANALYQFDGVRRHSLPMQARRQSWRERISKK